MSTDCAIEPGKNYVGTIAVTEKGHTCQRWDTNSPHINPHQEISKYPGISSLSQLENYCRNPDNGGRPWCYTINTDDRWDYCSVPCCSGKYTSLFLIFCIEAFAIMLIFAWVIHNIYVRDRILIHST